MVQLYSLWDNPPIKYSDYLKKKGSVYTMNIIDKITQSQMKKDLPEFRVGDSVTVGCIITETKGGKSKERVQEGKRTWQKTFFTVRSIFSIFFVSCNLSSNQYSSIHMHSKDIVFHCRIVPVN